MKTLAIAIAFSLCALPALAQPTVVDPNKPDAELSKDEATIRITEFQGRVNTLKSRLDALNGEINTLRQEQTQLATSLDDCNKALYALVGATEADVQNFRERLGRIETRVREMQRMSDDELSKMGGEITGLENSLNGMRREKIALLPEFYNKIISLAADIKGLRRTGSSRTYTVGTWAKDRDCLWNIAAKEQIYGDPFMWPKIWQANTDQIRNPDVIRPGQVLTIPPAGPKTDEELAAERAYYRQRRVAVRRASVRRSQQLDQPESTSGQ